MTHEERAPFILMEEENEIRKKAAASPITSIFVDPAIWIDEHGDFLFRFAMMRVHDQSVSEDLVQETLLSAIQSMAAYRGQSSVRTWLTSILKNKICDLYRKRNLLCPIAEEDLELRAFDHFFERDDQWTNHWNNKFKPIEFNETPEMSLERGEFRAVLNSCIAALPKRASMVFQLREVDGYSGEEICDMLGLASNNFWVVMHRARMQLRTCLELKWFRKPG